jgi:hypothetical protein
MLISPVAASLLIQAAIGGQPLSNRYQRIPNRFINRDK